MSRPITLLVVLGCFVSNAPGYQNEHAALGVFQEHGDVGTVLHPGSAAYDASTRTYSLTGSGENIWATNDQFQFLWAKVSGEVALSATIVLPGEGGDNHRKAVLMIRQSLDPDSQYADAALHGDGLTSLQFRGEKGDVTHELQSNITAPERLRLEKRGDRFFMWIAARGEELHFAGGSTRVPLTGNFYIGIGVCAHNKDNIQKARFAHVELTSIKNSAGLTAEQYSTLETVTVASTDARVSYVTNSKLSRPSWNSDPKFLAFRAEAAVQRVAVAGGTPESLQEPSSEAVPERSHVSKDTYLASNRGGTMQIWRSAPDSSEPEQLTSDEFDNLTPHLSPDDHALAFLSVPRGAANSAGDKDVHLRVMTLSDRKIKTVAIFVGGEDSLGSQPWSPDTLRLTFVSYQTIP